MKSWQRHYQGIVSCGCKYYLTCPSRPSLRENKRQSSVIFCSIRASKCRNIPFISVFAQVVKLQISIPDKSKNIFLRQVVFMSSHLQTNSMDQWSLFVGKRRIRARKTQISMCFFDLFLSVFGRQNRVGGGGE